MNSTIDNKDDVAIDAFMAAYMAPATDDGFTQAVMQKARALHGFIEPEITAAETRLRRVAVYGACFIGGIIAAAQLPKLLSLASSMVNSGTNTAAITLPRATAATDRAQISPLRLSQMEIAKFDVSEFDISGIMNVLPTMALLLAALIVAGAIIWVIADEGVGQTL